MNADKACQVRWRAFQEEFGADDDIVFVVEGRGAARMEQALDALAADLQASPELFDRVFHRVDLRGLNDRALLFLSEPEIAAIESRLAELGPLLGPGSTFAWRGLTLQNLIAWAEAILVKREQGGQLSETDRAFLRQFASIVAAADKTVRNPDDQTNPWTAFGPVASNGGTLDRPRYFFSDDGMLAFLLARPAHPDRQSFTPAAEAVNAARQIVERARSRFPDLQFGLTGLPVLEHDEMAGTDRDSMWAAWLALAAVAVLYFFVYRGFRYPLLTVGSLAAGTVWALGLTAVTIGHLNILSSAFAVMLIGIGDYGVLWVARFDEERKLGRPFDAAIRHTAEHAGPSIIIAALSTSLAFYATMLADFQAVSELGFIAGSGVLLCALACLVLIPAIQGLLQRWRPSQVHPVPFVSPFFGSPFVLGARSASKGSISPLLALRAPYNLLRRPAAVIAVAGIAVLAAAPLAIGLRYDDNLLHLQSTRMEAVRWEMKLLQKTEGAGWSSLSVASSPEEAIALRKRYEQLAEVGRVDEIASLIPVDQERKLPALARINERLGRLPAKEQIVNDPSLSASSVPVGLDRLIGHLYAEPDLLRVVRSFRDSLDDSVQSDKRIASFNRHLAESLWNDLHRLRQASVPRAITVDDLPPSLRERFISMNGKWLVRAYAKEDVWDNTAMERFVTQTRTVDPEATGKSFGTFEGLRALKNGFLLAGLYALAAIALVLYADFRQARDVLLGLLPLALGMVILMALLRLFDVALNPANLIVLPLIVGVGVDNGVHILHDYRSKSRAKPYRMSAATGRGILVAALTTIVGFATLMISRHQGMRSLGFALALGVTCCMCAALVVLPAMLTLLDRRRLRRAQAEVETRQAA